MVTGSDKETKAIAHSPNSETPLVSVGIPTFNNASTLSAVLDCVRKQTYTNLEILISDNGSTDGTQELCRSLSEGDDRIKSLLHPYNRGAAWNFNHLLRMSSGELFVWVAPGDVWHETYVDRCVELLQRDPQISLVHSVQQRFDKNGQLVGRPYLGIDNLSDSASARWRTAISRLEIHMAIYGVMRRSDALAVRPTQPSSGADLVFVAEMSLRGTVHQVPDLLFWKQVPPQGVPNRSARELHLLLTGEAGSGLRHVFPHADLTREAIRSLRSASLPPEMFRSLRNASISTYFFRLRWLRDLSSVLRHVVGSKTYNWWVTRIRSIRSPF